MSKLANFRRTTYDINRYTRFWNWLLKQDFYPWEIVDIKEREAKALRKRHEWQSEELPF